MEKMVLTAEEINEFDTISSDILATNAALEVALNYHANRSAELEKKKTNAWNKVAERFNLDIKTKAYRIDTSGPEVIVVEKKD